MPNDPHVMDLIAHIYDSVLTPEAWPEILDRLSSAAGLRAANIFAGDHSHQEVGVTAASSWVPAEVLHEYASSYIQYDAPALKLLSSYTPRVLVGIRDLSPNPPPLEEWFRSRLGIYSRFAVRLNDHRAWVDGMNFHLGHKREVLSAMQRSVIEAALPHFAKVVEVSRPFHLLRARFQAVIAVLDRIHLGVIILNQGGHLVVKNREARRILELNDGLTLDRNGRLALSEAAASGGVEWAKAIDDAIATARGLASVPEKLLAIRRPSLEDPLIAEVSPLTGAETELPRSFKGALILVVDPMRSEVASTASMEMLYDLTPAESAVLVQVIEGLTTPEIADSRNTSPETVKTQIRAVFAKTRTQTRAALIRLALTVNLPIDPAPTA